MGSTALSIHNLSVIYNNLIALENITASIPQGILCAIVGPNGAGKTTLIKSIVGLIAPSKGSITLLGNTIKTPIAYIPQRATIDWQFPITVFDVVLMGSYARVGWFYRPNQSEKIRTYTALEKVGLLESAQKPIQELSGGQQQRMFLARALCQDAQLYLMDEPFSGVDITTQQAITTILKQLRQTGKTIVIVHHNLKTIDKDFDWVFMLNIQKISCGPVNSAFTQRNVIAAYGTDYVI